MRTGQRVAAIAGAVAWVILLAGCGTPGAPLPPSLNLPDRVTDLAAARNGNRVTLTWTMPRRNTDKLLLKGIVAVRVCRREGADAEIALCDSAGTLELAPGLKGSFDEVLPSSLSSGAPRALSYFVELTNHKGRSAGLSNAALVLAGEAPAPVAGLAAQVRKDGVALRWTSDQGSTAQGSTAIRLERTLLTAPPPRPHTGPLQATPEPAEQNLLVESAAGAALDKNITLGNTYEYRAQRVLRQSVDGKTLDLNGELSPPVRVEALDVFPPAIPTGLVAVATAADAATASDASIDLSWQPNTEADLAGYEVFRRDEQTPWQQISGDQPVPGPAFHDAHVLPGHTYRYAVSAMDHGGHTSARSQEAQETVPSQ